MIIVEDTRQKADKHKAKNDYWSEHGDAVIRCKLPFGDYAQAPKKAVDTKVGSTEIAGNMCGSMSEKRRFREECSGARDAGCELIFLIEDDLFGSIADLYGAKIPIHTGQIIPGDQLARAMEVMSARYGCRFEFCRPEEAGRRVKELLEDG